MRRRYVRSPKRTESSITGMDARLDLTDLFAFAAPSGDRRRVVIAVV